MEKIRISGKWYDWWLLRIYNFPEILQLLWGLVAEQARLVKTCQSSVWVAKLMLDQTVGCSTREGVYFWVNWRYCDRYRLGRQPVISQLREGSMYSQAYISIVFGTWYPRGVDL